MVNFTTLSGSLPGIPYDESFLSVEQARKILPLSAPWYAKARAGGYGPPFVRVGARVLYPKSKLLAYCMERLECGGETA